MMTEAKDKKEARGAARYTEYIQYNNILTIHVYNHEIAGIYSIYCIPNTAGIFIKGYKY